MSGPHIGSTEWFYLLALRAIARADLDRGEVLPEIARAAHDKEAVAIGGLREYTEHSQLKIL